MQISAEVITLLGSFMASTLIYIITSWIQQRNKRSSTLRLIGSIYRPHDSAVASFIFSYYSLSLLDDR
ncbi:MAG: hypothetical protein RRE78_07305 [Acidianus sp.]|nr:hypothetical protein [Acidianus sp.]